jgi:FixJ family two-component response regulator
MYGFLRMSGLELQQRLLAKAIRIPIVFISAEEDRGGLMRAQALCAGAVAFLSKPFADDELLHAIQSALARHS